MNAARTTLSTKRSSKARGQTKPKAVVGTPPNAILSRTAQVLDPARCHQMIAEAAYFYAERRGFKPGYELDDWLAAEDQVNALLTLSEVREVYGDP